MRLIDVLFRARHLSEAALVRALTDGGPPAHLGQCDTCAERALMLRRWLDDTRNAAVDLSDTAFPAGRLELQRAQILRRLEQYDRAPQLLVFPAPRLTIARPAHRRVSSPWLGVAVATGVVIGVAGAHTRSGLDVLFRPIQSRTIATTKPPSSDNVPATNSIAGTGANTADHSSALFDEVDRPQLRSVEALAAMTPRQTSDRLVYVRTER